MFITALYAPTVILLGGWVLWRHSNGRRKRLLWVWLATLAVLALIGASRWEEAGHADSRLVQAILFTSAVWFTGPLLLYTIGSKRSPLWTYAGCAILPYPSYLAGFILLVTCGKIWI